MAVSLLDEAQQLLLCHAPLGPSESLLGFGHDPRGDLDRFLDAIAVMSTCSHGNETSTVAVAMQRIDSDTAPLRLFIATNNGRSNDRLRQYLLELFRLLRPLRRKIVPGFNHYSQQEVESLVTYCSLPYRTYRFVWSKFWKTLMKNGRLVQAIQGLGKLPTSPDGAFDPQNVAHVSTYEHVKNALTTLLSFQNKRPTDADILLIHFTSLNIYDRINTGWPEEAWDGVLDKYLNTGFRRYIRKVAAISTAVIHFVDTVQLSAFQAIMDRAPDIVNVQPELRDFAADLGNNLCYRLCAVSSETKSSKAQKIEQDWQKRILEPLINRASDHWPKGMMHPYYLGGMKFRKDKSEAHCEALFAKYIVEHRIGSTNYIGCQKLACFGCRIFLEGLLGTKIEYFAMRGCHGKIYPPYAFPTIQTLSIAQQRDLGQTLSALIEASWKNAWSYKRHVPRKSDSSVSGSSEPEVIGLL